MADTGGRTLAVDAPAAARVSLARVTPAPAGVPSPPLPDATPGTPPTPVDRDAGLATDDQLHPPLLKRPGTLIVPPGRRADQTVELDVLVDVAGRVVQVRWADGARDSALVRAAERCAEEMSFYPAQLRGQPIAVWCRQKFEFSAR